MASLEHLPVPNHELMQEIHKAVGVLDVHSRNSVVRPTKLFSIPELSEVYDADIVFASEIHQDIGAYKIRGAYNFVHNLSDDEREKGVVTASAGNHAQGIALSCNILGVKSRIYMPKSTPEQKIQRVRELGGDSAEVILIGQIFDTSESMARKYERETGAVYAPPFNHSLVIAGQGTLGLEIAQKIENIDEVFCPVGGMGLFAGVSTAIRSLQPQAKMIAVEPFGAASLKEALAVGRAMRIKDKIDTRVDGASVKKVGDIPFDLSGQLVHRVETATFEETRIATTYLWEREHPIKVELAGALALAGIKKSIKSVRGKRVVCILSGGNLSEERYQRDIRLIIGSERHSA